MTSLATKIGSCAENAANNISNVTKKTWTLLFLFGNELFQKPFKDREIFIKVIETEVIAKIARTKSFQLEIDIIRVVLLVFFYFPQETSLPNLQ